jgi:hypothetical protein
LEALALIGEVLTIAEGSLHLALNLGLLSVPAGRLAAEARLYPGGEDPHPFKRLPGPQKRLLASPHRRAGAAPCLEVSAVALIVDPLARIGDLLALVGDPLPLVRQSLTLVGVPVPLVGATVSFGQLQAELVGRSIVRGRVLTPFSHAFNLQIGAAEATPVT